MSHLASGREARIERYFSVQIIFAQSGSQDFQATREQKIRKNTTKSTLSWTNLTDDKKKSSSGIRVGSEPDYILGSIDCIGLSAQ